MSRSSDRSGRGRDPGKAPDHLITRAADTVVLRVVLTEGFPNAAKDLEWRIYRWLKGTGILVGISGHRVSMVGMSGPISPGQWTRIIGWLMAQPEVQFVVRVEPVTIRVSGGAGHSDLSRPDHGGQ